MQRTIIVLSLLLSVLQAPAGLASTYDLEEAKAAMDAYQKKDFSTAYRKFKALSEQGHPEGQAMLGKMLINGQGVARDVDESLRWLEKSATQGYSPAQLVLGNFYKDGRFVAKSEEKAAYWYRKAAAQGDSVAKQNLQEMGKSLTDVAEEKPSSVTKVTTNDENSNLPTTQLQKAKQPQKVATEAKQESTKATQISSVATTTAAKDSCPKLQKINPQCDPWCDPEVTKCWAEHGNIYARHTYGRRLLKIDKEKDILGWTAIPKNVDLGIYWLEQSLPPESDNHKYGSPAHTYTTYSHIGYIYLNGEVVPKDIQKAEYYFKKDAEHPNSTGYSLGRFYLYKPSPDYKAALYWLKRADESKLYMERHTRTALSNHLAWLYETGNGTSKNLDEALKYYKQACNERGYCDSDAQKESSDSIARVAARLAENYYFGINGYRKDRKQAAVMLDKVLSLNKEHPRANYLMGYMRENGDGGLEKDPYNAYYYNYLKAAAGGDADGKAAVKRLSAWYEEESDRRISRSIDEDNRIAQQTRRCDNWGNCTCLRGGVYMGC